MSQIFPDISRYVPDISRYWYFQIYVHYVTLILWTFLHFLTWWKTMSHSHKYVQSHIAQFLERKLGSSLIAGNPGTISRFRVSPPETWSAVCQRNHSNGFWFVHPSFIYSIIYIWVSCLYLSVYFSLFIVYILYHMQVQWQKARKLPHLQGRHLGCSWW